MGSDRMDAMQWWYTKPTDKEKCRYMDEILDFPGRHPKTLTGREVEIIYNRVVKKD